MNTPTRISGSAYLTSYPLSLTLSLSCSFLIRFSLYGFRFSLFSNGWLTFLIYIGKLFLSNYFSSRQFKCWHAQRIKINRYIYICILYWRNERVGCLRCSYSYSCYLYLRSVFLYRIFYSLINEEFFTEYSKNSKYHKIHTQFHVRGKRFFFPTPQASRNYFLPSIQWESLLYFHCDKSS